MKYTQKLFAMPFKLRLKKTKRYNVSSKYQFVVAVQLLDNTVTECTLTPDSPAQECLESIAQRIEIGEIQYFGLKYVNKKLQYRWVELDKPLKKQLDKYADNPLLYFGVVFYINNAHKIHDEMTRYQFFLQLKNDVIEGRVACAPDTAILLASYSLQAEFGDHDYERHSQDFLKDFVLLPRPMTSDDQVLMELMQEVTNGHRSLQGVPPSDAEIEYIKVVQQLDGCGQDYFPAKDDSGKETKEILLGSSVHGIYVRYPDSHNVVFHRWNDIKEMSHNKKYFVIQPEKQPKNIQFLMDDPETAKYMWNMCIQQHQFFKMVRPDLSSGLDEKDLFPQQEAVTAIPDIQRSVQQAQLEGPDIQPQQTVLQDDEMRTYQEVYPADVMYPSHLDNFSHSQYSLEQAADTQYANGHLANNPVVFGVPHTPQGHMDMADGGPDQRNHMLPSYRPSPDYDTVMRQRLGGQIQHNNIRGQLEHNNIGYLEHNNLGNAMVYSQPETMAYSQPEMRNAPEQNVYDMQEQYLNLVQASAFGNVNPEPTSIVVSRPVDRANSLIIHPTYSTPDLHKQQMPENSQSENVMTDLSYYFKPPPPYPRPSRSTPDLASQTQSRLTSDSPDLVSRKNINPNIDMQVSYAQYQSFDNLANETRVARQIPVVQLQESYEDVNQNIQIQEKPPPLYSDVVPPHVAKNIQKSLTEQGVVQPNTQTSQKQYQSFDNLAELSFDDEHVVEDDSEAGGEREAPPDTYDEQSDYSDATFHEHRSVVSDSDEEGEKLEHDDLKLTNTDFTMQNQNADQREQTSCQSDVPTQAKILVQEVIEQSQLEIAHGSGKNQNQATATTNTTSLDIKHSYHYSDSSQDSLLGATTDKMKTLSVEEEAIQPVDVLSIDPVTSQGADLCNTVIVNKPPDVTVNTEPRRTEIVRQEDSDHDSIQCLDVSKLEPESPKVGGNHSKTSSIDTASLGAGSKGSYRGSKSNKKNFQGQQDDSDSDDDPKLKRRSVGPLKMAAMNGLTVSRPTLRAQQNDETRAPKDERRKTLESKLEEGQVFLEYEKLPKKKPNCNCSTAQQQDNVDRNRFRDVLPYEENRVKLKPNKENKTGYINASHINMKIGPEEFWYIAAQAPTSVTAGEFWQMIWENGVQVIAMLTELQEAGRQRCHPYWPGESNATLTFGEYDVTLKFANDSLCYVTSQLNLKHRPSKKNRTLWHLQYTDWPDHGCPDDIYGFLSYLDEIESVHRLAVGDKGDGKKSPLVIHCTAGVGRTGVVILTEVMKACLEHNEHVDVPGILGKIREQRMHMVQTISQYSFVYKTLIQYLKNSRLI